MERTLSKAEKFIFHVFSIALIVFSVHLTFTRFSAVSVRVGQALEDFVRSLIYHMLGYADKHEQYTATVQTMPNDMTAVLPISWGEFKTKIKYAGELLVNKHILALYFGTIGNVISDICLVLLTCSIPMLLLFLATWLMYRSVDNEHGKKSHALRAWYKLEDIVWYPLKTFVVEYVRFVVFEYRRYLIVFCLVWAWNLNVLTIALEAVAWVLWVPFSLKFGNIFVQIAKLGVDLTVAINFLPIWAWAIVGYVIFNSYRRGVGFERLEAGEELNKRFLLEHPGNLIATGPPRVGKTQAITDMSLSQEIIYREIARDGSFKRKMQFPFFEWAILEQSIRKMWERVPTFSLEFIREWIEYMKSHFEGRAIYNPDIQIRGIRKLQNWGYQGDDFICNYDYKRHGLKYDDNLTIVNLFESVEMYALQYTVYSYPSPLIFSGHPIRTDIQWIDFGNYPIMRADFFRRKPRELLRDTKWSHIINQDGLRLGIKKDPNGIYNNSYDIGTAVISEIGKELGNQVTNRESSKSKKSDEVKCTPNNDLWTLNAKMISHGLTIDYNNYFRIFGDEQRIMSILADFRELGSEVEILKKGKEKIKMPFFAFEELAYVIAKKIMDKLFLFFKSRHGKMTLFYYLALRIYSLIYNHYIRVYNQFASYQLEIKVKDHSQNDTAKEQENASDICKYNISRKKICSDRYNTAFFGTFYREKFKKSKVGGLHQTPQYTGLNSTIPQMKFQKSRFNDEIFEHFGLSA